MIRVVLVDDHPVVLGGLHDALRGLPDMEVVGSARTLDEARTLLDDARPDVVLLDIRLPDGSGLDLLATPRTRPPAFLVLSSFDTPRYVAAAVELGAEGFLLKTAPLADLVRSIRRVAAGGTAFESRHLNVARDARGLRLTRRERDVVEGVLAGRSNDEIGADLRVARKTVEAYLTRLYRRFEVSSRTELALRVEREAWTVEE